MLSEPNHRRFVYHLVVNISVTTTVPNSCNCTCNYSFKNGIESTVLRPINFLGLDIVRERILLFGIIFLPMIAHGSNHKLAILLQVRRVVLLSLTISRLLYYCANTFTLFFLCMFITKQDHICQKVDNWADPYK